MPAEMSPEHPASPWPDADPDAPPGTEAAEATQAAPEPVDDSERAPVLVLGATGSFGGAIAHELAVRGRPIRVFCRDERRARERFGTSPKVEIVEGDVQNGAALARAADGCRAIVHGVSYPYHQWDPAMRLATNNIIGAARAHRLTILFPGNVYGLGMKTGAPIDESAEMEPITRKGRFRVELERSLWKATSESGVRVIILRAGDFFGPTVRNELVDMIFGRAAAGRSIRAIGNLESPHQWVYVPDLARAGAQLLTKAKMLKPFEVIHFGGHVAPSQESFFRDVARMAGYPNLPIRRIPWTMLRLAATFKPVVRELFELRYLFEEAIVLDDAKLRRLLTDYAPTPMDDAVMSTLASYR